MSMWSSSSESESPVATSIWSSSSSETDSPLSTPKSRTYHPKKQNKRPKKKRASERGVVLEGYVECPETVDRLSDSNGEPVAARTKSLTDDDLEELKGCVDLGFGFNYEEIPELCNTLPALELCYSMTRRLSLEENSCKSVEPASDSSSLPSSPIPVANWKISSPGDDPDEQAEQETKRKAAHFEEDNFVSLVHDGIIEYIQL